MILFPPPLGNQFSGSHVTSGNQGFSQPRKPGSFTSARRVKDPGLRGWVFPRLKRDKNPGLRGWLAVRIVDKSLAVCLPLYLYCLMGQ
jgi:hypothetical protein